MLTPNIADRLRETISLAITRFRAVFATERTAVAAITPTERGNKIFFHVLWDISPEPERVSLGAILPTTVKFATFF
jgi:hypothetical protein